MPRIPFSSRNKSRVLSKSTLMSAEAHGTMGYLQLQATADTKLAQCVGHVATLHVILLLHNASAEVSTSATCLTLHNPKPRKQTKMTTSKDTITLAQRHLCENTFTENIRERMCEFAFYKSP